MFLKSLTLKGFKSFADPVTLRLEPGVTVVVGPNGSGKSNVVDAVAWVLGAQGARALRGSKMEDVIFAGSADRPALGRAEVALTIDNRAGRLPGGLAEITITRILFRSGDSEYAMNGQPCRLLDIQELLSDSGVGRTQHVIVGQGQLDHVLNARPEDRRAVIEEAAGVLKHRRRRERSERRLAAVEENLERLADLLRELRRQIRPLEKQASAARSHGRLTEELRGLRLHLAGRELAALSERIRVAAVSRDETQTESALLKERLSKIDEAVERATAELSSRDDEDLVLGMARTQGLAERCVGLGGVLSERGRSLERALAAAADVDVVSSLEADAARLTEQLAFAVGELEGFEPELALLNAEESALVEEGRSLESLPGEADVRAARQAQAVGIARVDAALNAIEIDREHLGRLTNHRGATARRLRHLSDEKEGFADQLESISLELDSAEFRRTEARDALSEAQRRLRLAEEASSAASRDHDRSDARAESLAGALEELEGTAGKDALTGAAGVHGSLAELLEIDAGFETAVHAALGGALSSIVVGSAHARDAVGLLHSNGVPGMLLPESHSALETDGKSRMPWVPPAEAEDLRSHVRATDLRAERLLDSLLERVGVVGEPRIASAHPGRRTWEVAADLALDHPDHTYLTTDGDRFAPDGWTVGLSARGLTGAVVEQARRDAVVASEAAARAADRVELASDAVRDATHGLEQAERTVTEWEQRRASVESSIERCSAVANALEGELNKSDPERHELERRIEIAESGIDELRREVGELAEKVETLAAQVSGAERSRLEHSVRRADLVERKNELQIRAGALAERRHVLSSRLEDVERRLSGHADERRQAEDRRRRIVADSIAVERLRRVVGDHQARVESVAVQLQEMRDEQVELLRAGGARLEDLRRQRVATDEELSTARDRHQRYDIELAEVGTRHQAAVEALERELGCSPEEALTAECPELAEGVSPSKRAADLQAELTRMGPINPLAAEELSELEERHEFLEREVDDVRRARRELQQVIREVDSEIARLFADAFADVDRHFQVLVGAMFPGGAGRLSLTDPTDSLGTGVELEARPAGKQVRRMSLLSGGERSLVALAFLFAVFRSRPSPFYVLDEVEAALDDVNLHRFLGLLHEFRSEAQLIVVSHQKRTMESADALYGVTMTPGGSSKVVSQRVGQSRERQSAQAVADPV